VLSLLRCACRTNFGPLIDNEHNDRVPWAGAQSGSAGGREVSSAEMDDTEQIFQERRSLGLFVTKDQPRKAMAPEGKFSTLRVDAPERGVG
jgi:hypothetical protein